MQSSPYPSPPDGTLPQYTRLRVFVLAVCGVWLALALAEFVPPLAPHRWPRVPRMLTISLVVLGQCVLLGAAARRSDLSRRLRQSLAMLSTAMLLVAVSDVLVAVGNLETTGPVFARINDKLEVAYTALGLIALFWMPLAPVRRNSRWLVAIDIAIAVGGMLIVLFVTTTLIGLDAAKSSEQSRIVLYALLTGGNLVALTIILVRGLAQPVPEAIWFLAGTVVLEIGYWVFAQFKLSGFISDGRGIDLIFAADQICYAMAGLAFLTARVEQGKEALTPSWVRDINPLPAVAMLAVGGMLVQRVLTRSAAGLTPLAVGLAGLSLLLVLRVMVAARERAQLIALDLATEQRLHADRVLSIRRLAGGIAHEFNNLMTVVIGTVDEELRALPTGAPAREGLESVREAGQRAADLTARLLTYAGDSFAGEANATRERVAPAELLTALEAGVRAVAGPTVRVTFDLAPQVRDVRVDRRLIEESVLHLVKNARAAMPNGGTLTIRLRERRLERAAPTEAILPAPQGVYAVISVSDDGIGMPPDDLHRIFDPFFGRESLAVASGLGLAVVHGVIANHLGGIDASSTPGAGTTISLLLPVE